jgi:hypothetical protein
MCVANILAALMELNTIAIVFLDQFDEHIYRLNVPHSKEHCSDDFRLYD